ncbi:MAG: hydantoinase/oxoprolinase family protein [Chloroflexota bacterium]
MTATANTRGPFRVTVDTGGTFSDFVIFDERTGHYRVLKVPSTPDDPSRAVLNGLDALAQARDGARVPSADVGFFCHGTTVATNALLEGRGARTGLVVTEGFRGIYEAMEQSRPFGPAIFNLDYQKPKLLAPESRTAEVRERVGADGEVRLPVDHASIDRAIAKLESEGVDAVAICFLFSFMNAEHERRVAERLKQRHPEWWVSQSSELLPQIREYYRLSTTVINAYVSPILGRYVDRLQRELDARSVAVGRRFTMQSNGGSSPFATTAERAVATILSGPAGGVTAGVVLAGAAGLDNVITFDMGGTSCDVALIQNGQPVITDRSKIDERHIAVPMLDINTVSAGGGTIAHVDQYGALHVGPQSAGARPGPACYGYAGDRATVTDADVVLGYLNPVSLLGGEFSVDADAARRVIQDTVATPLGVDLLRAADGIVRIVNVKMTEAIKAISTERGFDLRDFSLIAFGGAGPVHACQIALDLGIPRVLVPSAPGATSALGLLMSDVKHDFIRSRLENIEHVSPSSVNEVFASLAEAARTQLWDEGFANADIVLRYFADMRYAGQGYENPVPIDAVPLADGDLARCRSRFDDIHRQCHGHAAPGQPVEIVSYRLEAIGIVPRVELATLEAANDDSARAQTGIRRALFSAVSDVPVDVPVFARDRLRAGHTFRGPAIVEQYDATTVICPGQSVRVDAIGNLLVESMMDLNKERSR